MGVLVVAVGREPRRKRKKQSERLDEWRDVTR